MPLAALRELTLPTQKALTSRDQKTFLARSNYSSEVGTVPAYPATKILGLFAVFSLDACSPRKMKVGLTYRTPSLRHSVCLF